MRKQLKDIRTLLLLSSCLLVAACTGRASKGSDSETEKPVITVTLEPQRYFTEAIAGDKFKVVSMVPKGSSPETYDPVPPTACFPRRQQSIFPHRLYRFRTDLDGAPDEQYTPHPSI